MKFYQGSLPPLVWNPKFGKVTMIFVDGVYETKDAVEKEILTRVGYRHDPKSVPLHVEIKPIEVSIKPVKKVIPTKSKMLRKKSKKR